MFCASHVKPVPVHCPIDKRASIFCRDMLALPISFRSGTAWYSETERDKIMLAVDGRSQLVIETDGNSSGSSNNNDNDNKKKKKKCVGINDSRDDTYTPHSRSEPASACVHKTT